MALQWSEPKSPCFHLQHFLPRQEERKPPVVTVSSVSSPALVPWGQKRDMCSTCEKTAPSRKLRFVFFLFYFRNVGLDLALNPFFSIQAAPQRYLSCLRVTEHLVYLLQWAAESSEEWNYILDGNLGCSHVTEHWLKFPLVVVLTLAPISGNNVGSSNIEKSVEAVGILSTVSSCCLQLGDTVLQIL